LHYFINLGVFQMKKQLLIAAVAATMSSVAMADLSISGNAEVTIAQNSVSTEANIALRGSADAGSVTIDLTNTVVTGASAAGSFGIKNAYMKTSVAGVAVKAGTWKSGASNLGRSSVKGGAYSLTTSMGGVKAVYEETGTGSANSVTLSGSVSGVKLSHKISQQGDATETKVSGSVAGVDASYHVKDSGTAKNSAITLSTSTNGVKIAYTSIDLDTAITGGIDGAIADTTSSVAAGKHSAIALTTSVAGNSVTFKRVDLNSVKTNKFIVSRGNMKATYNDTTEKLEVELTVKF
jgi:hypothetical protein